MSPQLSPQQRVVMPAPGQGQPRVKRRRRNIHAPKLKPSQQTAGSMQVLRFGADLVEEAATRYGSKPTDEDGRVSVATSVAQSAESSDEDLHDQPRSPGGLLSGRMAAVGDIPQRSSFRAAQRDASLDETWPLEDLFKAESGLPTISNGICVLCGESTERCPWGNPACRGCSFVDGSELDRHVFKNIIVEGSQDISIGRPKVTAPPHVRRRDRLTPPPLQSATRELLRSQVCRSQASSSCIAGPKSWPGENKLAHTV